MYGQGYLLGYAPCLHATQGFEDWLISIRQMDALGSQYGWHRRFLAIGYKATLYQRLDNRDHRCCKHCAGDAQSDHDSQQ
jgi:hypothetical protein